MWVEVIMIDVNSLSRDELERILFDNVLSGFETAEMRARVRVYYGLLSLDDLRKKARILCNNNLYQPDVVIKTDARELKRRAIIEQRRVPVERTVTKSFNVTPTVHYKTNPDDEMSNELMLKPWVETSFVICDGHVAVKLNDSSKAPVIKRVAKRLNYKGEVHING